MSYLTVGEAYVPDLGAYVENAEAVVDALLVFELERVTARAKRGIGSDDRPLPRVKRGGTPGVDTGQLAASAKIRKTGGWGAGGKGPAGLVTAALPSGVVEPSGTRTDRSTKSRKRRQSRRRKETKEALVGAGLNQAQIRSEVRKAAGGRVQDRNYAVAAILNKPPKDARARAGGRPALQVFQVSPLEASGMDAIAQRMLEVVLVDRRTGDQFSSREGLF